MKRYLLIGMMILSSLLITSCSFIHSSPYPRNDLTQESWQRWIQSSPNAWARGADRWFLTGDPNVIEVEDHRAPYEAVISTMQVRVPDFSNISVNGDFEVQIFGAYDHNSVFIYGPNDQVRQVAVHVRNNTLCLARVEETKGRLNRVIVRIGIMNLNNLTQYGSGLIEGRQVRSDRLFINSSGSGNIYLAGNINLSSVSNRGCGKVSVFGACTSSLDILTGGKGGGVNISGNLGLRKIAHHGDNNINVIGANNTNEITINASGRGRIGIDGNVNIRQITAKNQTHVYANHVSSRGLNVYVSGSSRVGLAGYASDLYVNTGGSSSFLGRFLCAETTFARASDDSHMNITARNRMYAAATGGSVYFFGSPVILSQFISGTGTVIPIWGGVANGCSTCAPAQACGANYSYKGENMYAHRKRWKERGGYRGEG